MEDNTIRTAIETQENNNGVVVEIQDDMDGRQGWQRRQRRTSMVAEMQENRDGYVGGGDVVWQQMRCGTTEMEKWVGIMAMDWANINRERLPT